MKTVVVMMMIIIIMIIIMITIKMIIIATAKVIIVIRPVEINKILGGSKFIKKMLAKLVSWLRNLSSWNRLKCAEILHRVVLGNANSQYYTKEGNWLETILA